MRHRQRDRIAVSVNGEGRGHLTRMTALARRLEGRYSLAFWCPDAIRESLARAFPGVPVRAVPFLRIVMRGASLDLPGTAAANLPTLASAGNAVSALAAELEEIGPVGVLSDFEPFLPEAAARLGLPVLQLNHPGIVTRLGGADPEALVAKIVAARMMGRFDRLLLSSFYGGDIGPILRPEILAAAKDRRREDFVLVYAREGFEERFRDLARACPSRKFRFFPDPRGDYPSALASCRAIVAPAGHQTLSEALCLGVRVFAVPIAGQYEQRLNAEMLGRSGRGAWAPAEAFEEPLLRFLSELDGYPRRAEPGLAFRLGDDGERAARLVSEFFRSEAQRQGARPRDKAYARVTSFVGRLVPAGPPAWVTG